MFQALFNPATGNEAADRAMFWRVVAISMLVKLIFAAMLPLGVDEAYATAVAREFSWSFFDHPPIGFWSPVVAANLTGIEHPLIYRLPELLFGLITTFVMYALGRELGGSRAGLWTVVLYALAPAFMMAGGVFILPDGPLGLGSAICVLYLVRVVRAGDAAPLHYWVVAALGLALALGSKYQAALLPVAALVFAIVTPAGRRWFRSPGPYLAALLGVLGLVPTLIWNIQNDWASFSFHANRTGDGINIDNFVLMAVGQALYMLPPVLVLGLIGLRRGFSTQKPEITLVALVAMGPIVAFNIIYLFSDKSFPHWTFPGWQFALPLAAVWLAGTTVGVLRRVRIWLIWGAGLTWAVMLVVMLHVNFGVLTRWMADGPPKWDRTETVFNYGGLRPALEARGLLEDAQLIVVPRWIEAGILSTALAGDWPVRVLKGNPHHFAFMSGATAKGPGLLLGISTLSRSRRQASLLLKQGQAIDPNAEMLDPVILSRGGAPYVSVFVVRLNVP